MSWKTYNHAGYQAQKRGDYDEAEQMHKIASPESRIRRQATSTFSHQPWQPRRDLSASREG